MKYPLLRSSAELQAYLDTHKLVYETAEQIQKDFAMFGLEITFSGEAATAYRELHQQLINQIDHLLKHSQTTLIAVLYRIDLPEEELEKGFRELPEYNQVEAMAHLIIVRELKKVLSRKFYK